MEVKQTYNRIRDNINNHKQYLSSKGKGVIQSGNTQTIHDDAMVLNVNDNEYETTKPSTKQKRPASPEESDTLLTDQLRREQQKCRVLKQRLQNKEVFINQLKDFQSELTEAFDKSQAQLHSIMLQNDTLMAKMRRLHEENQQLRNLIIHMQQTHNSNASEGTIRRKARVQENRQYSQRQLVTAPAAVIYKQAALQLAETLDCNSDEIIHQMKTIGKFIRYLWGMIAKCSEQARNRKGLKDRLKFSWKWLKEIVRESALIREENLKHRTSKEQIIGLFTVIDIQRILSENRQYLHLIRMMMDFLELSEGSSSKQLELVLKELMHKR